MEPKTRRLTAAELEEFYRTPIDPQSLKHPDFRLRMDKLNFYFDVYDLAMKGTSFKIIARILGKKLSTVKMAFRAACQEAYGKVESKVVLREAALNRAKGLPSRSSDFKTHIQGCGQCQSGRLCNLGDKLLNRESGVREYQREKGATRPRKSR